MAALREWRITQTEPYVQAATTQVEALVGTFNAIRMGSDLARSIAQLPIESATFGALAITYESLPDEGFRLAFGNLMAIAARFGTLKTFDDVGGLILPLREAHQELLAAREAYAFPAAKA